MNADIVYAHTDSPFGPVWVAATETGICTVTTGTRQPDALFAWLSRHISPEPPRKDREGLAQALAQLHEYFSRARQAFDLPLDVRGTAFQRAVWTEISRIPYGTTTTYSQIAEHIGRPKAARAVGAAVGANSLPILIPCHRVIGAGGSLTGYGGGLEMKAGLLRMEGVLSL